MSEEEQQPEPETRLGDETFGPLAMMVASFAFAGISYLFLNTCRNGSALFSIGEGLIGIALIALAACTILLFRSQSVPREQIGLAIMIPVSLAILAAISGMAWWLLNLDLGEELGMPVGIAALLGCLWGPLAVLMNVAFCLTRKKYRLLPYVVAQCVFFATGLGVFYVLVKVSESC